jgi:stalled ribosome alternative rescue factor ArfA
VQDDFVFFVMSAKKERTPQAPKPRHHKALFDNDLPFQPRVERAKKQPYQRREKYPFKLDDE